MLKIALAVNEPPPYRIPIFNLIAAAPDIDLQVIFFVAVNLIAYGIYRL